MWKVHSLKERAINYTGQGGTKKFFLLIGEKGNGKSVKDCIWWVESLLYYGQWPVMDYYVHRKIPAYKTAQHMWTEHQRLAGYHLEQKRAKKLDKHSRIYF